MATNETWLGSGINATLIPEADLYLGACTKDATHWKRHSGEPTGYQDTGASSETGSLSKLIFDTTNYLNGSRYSYLITDIYKGCTADLYINGTYDSSYAIDGNDNTGIFIVSAASALPTFNGSDDYVIIRRFGAPVPGPYSASGLTLLSDNWVGLASTVSPPSVDIEMKQLNMALSGSRNWTYQYKGVETISGTNISLNANHAAWLFFALGKCTNVGSGTPSGTITRVGSETASNAYNWNTTHGNGTSVVNNTDADVADNALMTRRVIGSTIYPPIDPSESKSSHWAITPPNMASGTIANDLIYEFGESNIDSLPSFALEFGYQKGSSLGSVTTTGLAGAVTSNVRESAFARIVTGCQVNTLTMTADESMELTMSLDLATKSLTEPMQNYQLMMGKTSINDLHNFKQLDASSGTIVQEFLTPFFFSEGSIELWDTEYIRIQNVNITINNTLTDKRFIGIDRRSKYAIPAQRTYEITFTGLVTDTKLFYELRNETPETAAANQVKLEFTKDNGEYIKLHFDNFMVTNNTWPIPEDKGPVVVEWTIQPIELAKAEVKTHWMLM